jgi:hypothetical protein
MTTTTTTNGSDKQGVSDHYADITRPELEELYHYLANPETDSSIAMRDITKEYGEKVANLLMSMIDR